jgi:GrpB-like predicted nucleotidyltransferase (UPF0157 family)
MSRPLEVAPYDSRWPLEFEAERTRIAEALGGMAIRIDHHGPTAVPGLAAKPIIDIQVSVAALQPARVYAAPLEELGYTHLPHADDARCPFFRRPAVWPHTHHIHVVEAGGDEERRTLAFRDFLREHTEVAEEYARLKLRLAAVSDAADPESREAYARGKTEFVDRVIARSRAAGCERPI